MSPARVAPFAAALAVLAACAGPAAQPSMEQLDAAFRGRVLPICQKALESKRRWRAFPSANFDPAHPDPSTLPSVGDWLAGDVAATFSAWRDDLVALGTPAAGGAAWTAVINGVTDNVTENQDQVDAARADDAARFADATRRITSTHHALIEATRLAGIPECGGVVAS
jgi:hypothetical protein